MSNAYRVKFAELVLKKERKVEQGDNKQRFVDEQSRSNNQRYLNQRATFVKTIKTIKTNRSISVRCFPTRLSRDLSSALVYFVVMFMHDSLFGTRRSEPLPVSNE